MHSFLVKTSIQHFFILLPVRYLKKRSFFDFRDFIFGKQEKNIRVGEFLTGSVGLPETFFFFFFASRPTLGDLELKVTYLQILY